MNNSTNHPVESNFKPTNIPERLEYLDVLRGLAIFGILFVNMMYYAHPYVYYQIIGGVPWDNTIDRVTELGIRFIAEGKFITMLAMLFGIGMVIQMERAESKGVPFFPFYFRRMTILLLLGAVHAFLIWMGDILLAYALMGFVILFIFLNRKPKTIIIWGAICLLIPFLLASFLFGLAYLASLEPEMAQEMEQGAAQQIEFGKNLVERSLEAYGAGSFGEIMKVRALDVALMYAFGIFWMPVAFALMLFGVAVGKTGIPRRLDDHTGLLNKVFRWGLIVGVIGNTMALFGYIYSDPVEGDLWWIMMYFGIAIGSPALSLFYMTAVIRLYRNGALPAFFKRLSAVGRMALSNYILQSIICTLLFYNYGFGLYGAIGPAAGIVITIAIFALQLFISPLWLQSFHYGPIEWIWRTCTYMKLQPFRKQ